MFFIKVTGKAKEANCALPKASIQILKYGRIIFGRTRVVKPLA